MKLIGLLAYWHIVWHYITVVHKPISLVKVNHSHQSLSVQNSIFKQMRRLSSLIRCGISNKKISPLSPTIVVCFVLCVVCSVSVCAVCSLLCGMISWFTSDNHVREEIHQLFSIYFLVLPYFFTQVGLKMLWIKAYTCI